MTYRLTMISCNGRTVFAKVRCDRNGKPYPLCMDYLARLFGVRRGECVRWS